ncbi:MAG TPA: mercury resistance system periplasmic binding protein MerP [Stellaceae bacterium]|nr:mercury resistance system periplasmic binding protein MerP [Stellaceae bacterium]
MKHLLAALAIGAALLAGGTAMAAARTATLAVKNMYCSACPYIVKNALAKVPGVGKVAVSFANKTATVTYDPQKTTLAALTRATTQAGYPSAPVTDPAAAK